MIDPSFLAFPSWSVKKTYNTDSFQNELLLVPYDLRRPKESFPALLIQHARPTRFLLLYFHGNEEDLGDVRPFLVEVGSTLECHVMGVEYPGYGISSERPTADKVVRQGHSAMQFIQEVLGWPVNSVIVVGRSIGAAVAMKVSARWPVCGQCLFAPFLSVREMGKRRLGDWTENFVSANYLNNARTMEKVTTPTLIIHGLEDRIIPSSDGRLLFEICQGRKMLVRPMRLGHSNLVSDPAFFWNPMMKFFPLPGSRPSGFVLNPVPSHLLPLPSRPLPSPRGPLILPSLASRASDQTDSELGATQPEAEGVPCSPPCEDGGGEGGKWEDEGKEENKEKGFWGSLFDFVKRGLRLVFGFGL